MALVQPPPMRTYLTTRDSRRVGQWERGVRAEETRTYLKGNAGGSLRTPGHSTQCNKTFKSAGKGLRVVLRGGPCGEMTMMLAPFCG